MNRACRRCGESLGVTGFNFKERARGRLQVDCKTCSRRYVQDHYWRNKPYYVQKAMARNRVHRLNLFDRLLAYRRARPGVGCGEGDPVVLGSDHVDARSKRWDIADKVSDGCSWRTIEAEIAKCVVRCANCHRRRTTRQFGWYRLRSAHVPAPVAQRIEQQPSELWVGSSNLSGRANRPRDWLRWRCSATGGQFGPGDGRARQTRPPLAQADTRPPGPGRISRGCLTAERMAGARHTGEPGYADG